MYSLSQPEKELLSSLVNHPQPHSHPSLRCIIGGLHTPWPILVATSSSMLWAPPALPEEVFRVKAYKRQRVHTQGGLMARCRGGLWFRGILQDRPTQSGSANPADSGRR